MALNAQLMIIYPDLITSILASSQFISQFKQTQKTPILNIEQYWHGLHFLLTDQCLGGCFPLCHTILGRSPIGEMHGALLNEPPLVKSIAEVLNTLSSTTLLARFNADKMNTLEIYPQDWTHDNEAVLLQLHEYFLKLRDFYQLAAQEDCAILTYF